MATSSIQLTSAERPTYAHLFALADPQSTGMVNGSAAVSFFALSGLPTPVLGSIWSIADSDNNGFLGPAQFSAALRLIGHAQNGRVVTEDLVQETGPIPTFKGVTLPVHLTGNGMQTPSRSSSTMIQPQLTGNGGFGSSDIRPEDRARYTRIFASAGPQSGLLDGEKAKEIFVKSKLPFDKLGAIWNLADTKARGKLDLTDFIVGMHFIQSTMNGSLTTIPASLPAGLYEKAASASGGVSSSPIPLGAQHTGALGAQNTGGSVGFISRQMTGASQYATPGTPIASTIRSPLSTGIATPLQSQRTGSMFPTMISSNANWGVTPSDKAKSDRFFDGLDQDHKGVLEGQAAVPFFMQSGLNEATLAHVWDLSDITQSGSLTKDEFAVAMHLINLKITGSDLPSELPASLVPPSLRGTSLPQAINPKESDTQRDLFSLMDDDFDLPVSTASAFAVPASTSTAANQNKSTFTNGPFDDDFMGTTTTSNRGTSSPFPAAAAASPPPPPPPPPLATSTFSPISPVMTGASNVTGTNRFASTTNEERPTSQSAFQKAPFGDASADAANQRLALDSTQKSLSTLEGKKVDLEKAISSDANSISDLSTRLETVRMRHQTETEAVKALTERQAAQALELKKLREESVREEAELSRLRGEKDEIEQSVMKDREDVREMKRIVGEKTKEKEALKVELEKLKKEARMQKGLVAIGKKQLNQADTDVGSMRQEIEQVNANNVEEQHASHGEVPMSPIGRGASTEPEAALSPAASVRSTNPFDRIATHAGGAAAIGAAAGLASAAGMGGAILHHENKGGSPPAALVGNSYDDPFGAATTLPTNSSDVAATTTTSAAAPIAAFDDSFGHFDAPTPVADKVDGNIATAGGDTGNVNQAFDDAFADFDEPYAKETTVAANEASRESAGAATEAEDITASVPGSFAAAEQTSTQNPTTSPTTPTIAESRSRDVEESNEAVPTFREPTSVESSEVKPTSLEPISVEPNTSTTDDVSTESHLDKGKGLLRDGDHEDSSDEEEGPEDVENTARHLVDSPDEQGIGKAEMNPMAAAAAAAPATTLESATAPDVAANRFPELPEVSNTGNEPIPTKNIDSTAIPFSTATPFGASSLAPVVPSTLGESSDAGHLDSFHDAYSDAELGKDFSDSPHEGGFANVTSHERFSTALENNNNISASKTRRAPPPAPIRGSTTSTSPTSVFPSLNAEPIASSTVAPIDDFDAAFEDLGPANNETAANTSISTSTGFEDAFGDADGFDFVPSFNDRNGLSTSNTATSKSATHQTGGFEGFDSVFESAFEPPASATKDSRAAPPITTTTTTTTTASDPAAGSGFSFEDAFATTADSNTMQRIQSPTANTTRAAPPTLPSRNATSNNTGALPDDAAPVRQLCAMGFTRADVIKSLERSNYRTDKALERLLAQA